VVTDVRLKRFLLCGEVLCEIQKGDLLLSDLSRVGSNRKCF